MRCEDVQYQLTFMDHIPEGEISRHLEHCPACREYRSYLEKLQNISSNIEHPCAPGELIAQTRSKIRQKMQPRTFIEKTPRLIWMFSMVFLLLMLAWIVGLQILTVENTVFTIWVKGLSIVLVIQNMIMLLCSPLLLRSRHLIYNVSEFQR